MSDGAGKFANEFPYNLPIDDQLIAIVRIARAAGYDGGAEWIRRQATETLDQIIADFEQPGDASPDTFRTAAATVFGNCNGRRCGNLQAIEEFECLLADAEKRAEGAGRHLELIRIEWRESAALLKVRIEEERERANGLEFARDLLSESNTALTRKLATAIKIALEILDVVSTLDTIDAPAGEEGIAPRIIDGKFRAEVRDGHVVIVKTLSGEIVPEDEPLVLMRGRDHLMIATLNHYRRLCQLDDCNEYQLGLVDELISKFVAYASDPSRMKQPGITRGAAWNPDAPSPEPALDQTAPNSPADWDRVLNSEPTNAQGSDAAHTERCVHCVNTRDIHSGGRGPALVGHLFESASSSRRFTAAEARETAKPYGVLDWFDAQLPSNARERRLINAALLAYADLLDRGDALERAAERVLAVISVYEDPMKRTEAFDNLRSVLTQRAGKVK